jgi:type I restriction-modification system DNA methylase subunit
MARSAPTKGNASSATIGFEAQLWLAADKLRSNMDAAEYKHVVLGLIFLKYISDTFEEHRAKLVAGQGLSACDAQADDYAGADPEDADEYRAENVFWVPADARWSHLQAKAKQPTIGKIVDDAMVAIERDNPRLKGVLPKDYARPALDKQRLGELIDLIGTIALVSPSPPAPLPLGEGGAKREVRVQSMHFRGGYDFSGLVERARELRKKQTPAEVLLWKLLRDRQLCGAKFRRQHQFGDYLCDFYCDETNLVVECDGEPHHTAKGKQHDAKRDAFLRSQGLTVLHFENDRVITDTDTVLHEIAAHLPSPAGRRAGDEGGQEDGSPANTTTHRSVDLLGRVYEYFLTMFASAEGKNGGQFYTPSCVVRLLVEMLLPAPSSSRQAGAPYKGRIYDPCCGSGGMFVQSEKFVEAHGGKLGDISIYGQESNATTRRLAIMNLAIRGIEADFGEEHADTFRRDLHPDLRADYVLANPPFNDSDWFRKDDDVRWQFGVPPKGNANFAWVQHFIHHLAPQGMAGFVLANGSMSSNQSGEGEIRQKLIEADLVSCMVALPGQLFYSTQIPVCLWFLRRDKSGRPPSSPALLPRGEGRKAGTDRRKQTLFIDARKLGTLIDRVHRELTDDDLAKIVSAYHAWLGHPLPLGEGRGEGDPAAVMKYQDVPGFCKSATTAEIAGHSWVLTPGRYVGAEEVEDDGDPFEEKMPRLVAELKDQFAESDKLEAAIRANLKGLGFK